MPITVRSAAQQSTAAIVLNLVKCSVGAGSFALPWAVAQVGWLLGCLGLLSFWALTVSTILQLAWIEAELFAALPPSERRRREASGQRLSYPELAAIAVPSAAIDCTRVLRCTRASLCGSSAMGASAVGTARGSISGVYRSALGVADAQREGELRSLRPQPLAAPGEEAGDESLVGVAAAADGDDDWAASRARGYSTGSIARGVSLTNLSAETPKMDAGMADPGLEAGKTTLAGTKHEASGSSDPHDRPRAEAADIGSPSLLRQPEQGSRPGQANFPPQADEGAATDAAPRPRSAMVMAARAALGARSAGLVNWVSVVCAAGIVATSVGVGAAYVDFVANVVSSAVPDLDSMEAAAIVSPCERHAVVCACPVDRHRAASVAGE